MVPAHSPCVPVPQVWAHFCSPGDASSGFATCLTKAKPNDIRGNPHLVQFYQVHANYF